MNGWVVVLLWVLCAVVYGVIMVPCVRLVDKVEGDNLEWLVKDFYPIWAMGLIAGPLALCSGVAMIILYGVILLARPYVRKTRKKRNRKDLGSIVLIKRKDDGIF